MMFKNMFGFCKEFLQLNLYTNISYRSYFSKPCRFLSILRLHKEGLAKSFHGGGGVINFHKSRVTQYTTCSITCMPLKISGSFPEMYYHYIAFFVDPPNKTHALKQVIIYFGG